MSECENKKDDHCPHADESADRAVKKVFAMFGVNIDNPEAVANFQQDMRFGSKMRRISDRVNITVITVVVVAVVSGTLAMIWKKVTE